MAKATRKPAGKKKSAERIGKATAEGRTFQRKGFEGAK
jgi:hypothetical protein